jgi:hypothetical protein
MENTLLVLMIMTNGYQVQLNGKTGRGIAREKYIEPKLDKLVIHTDRIPD